MRLQELLLHAGARGVTRATKRTKAKQLVKTERERRRATATDDGLRAAADARAPPLMRTGAPPTADTLRAAANDGQLHGEDIDTEQLSLWHMPAGLRPRGGTGSGKAFAARLVLPGEGG